MGRPRCLFHHHQTVVKSSWRGGPPGLTQVHHEVHESFIHVDVDNRVTSVRSGPSAIRYALGSPSSIAYLLICINYRDHHYLRRTISGQRMEHGNTTRAQSNTLTAKTRGYNDRQDSARGVAREVGLNGKIGRSWSSV